MKASQYADMGKYLRDIRESQRIQVEEAATTLHIRAKYLYDLEEGNFNDMPGKVYIRGYIKNYAEYLRLDSKEVLEEYEKLFEKSANQKFFVPENSIYKNTPSHTTLWISFISLLLLYGYWYFGLYDRPPVMKVIVQTPEQPVAKMNAEWEKCFNDDATLCFLDLYSKGIVPEASILTEKPSQSEVKAAVAPKNEEDENDRENDE